MIATATEESTRVLGIGWGLFVIILVGILCLLVCCCAYLCCEEKIM